jgi:hypothetical protein
LGAPGRSVYGPRTFVEDWSVPKVQLNWLVPPVWLKTMGKEPRLKAP